MDIRTPIIDLHMHSTASDGQYAPRELVRLAKAHGIAVMALTDHDSAQGAEEAIESAGEVGGIEVIAGIELSAVTAQGQETHILGHFIDVSSPLLADFSRRMHEERINRMHRMIAKMNAAGVDVTFEEAARFATDGASIGRTHLTRALMARGEVQSLEEAFERYLGKGKPAYVPREKLTADEAIGLIHRLGGTAAIAHAKASGVIPDEIRRLRDAGLDGLEVWHPRHSERDRKELLALADELGLIPTAGSDFHGEKVAPSRHLGCVSTPLSSLEALRAQGRDKRAKKIKAAESSQIAAGLVKEDSGDESDSRH